MSRRRMLQLAPAIGYLGMTALRSSSHRHWHWELPQHLLGGLTRVSEMAGTKKCSGCPLLKPPSKPDGEARLYNTRCDRWALGEAEGTCPTSLPLLWPWPWASGASESSRPPSWEMGPLSSRPCHLVAPPWHLPAGCNWWLCPIPKHLHSAQGALEDNPSNLGMPGLPPCKLSPP